jgi:ABC-type phosphate transport system substrate-binding protein
MTLNRLLCGVAAAALSLGTAHATTTTTLNTGGSSLAAPTYIALYQLYTQSHPSVLWNYEAVGSGSGQNAFLNNQISYFENVPAGTLTYGTIVGTQVDLGASDAALSASQLTNPATGSYANSASDGPLIQIPTIGTPITIPYNQSVENSASSPLKLTDDQVCGVLSGKITDWHSLNSKIPAGTTIEVAYRSDGSGTTFLLTQHLNKVCNSSNSSFPTLPVPITKYFVSSTPSNDPVFATAPGSPASFTGESGSANVAAYLVATANSFSYLSPDYTSIAPKSANTTSLKVASLVNAANNTAYQPSVSNTQLGLANAGAGATNSAPPSTKTAAMDPLNWVPLIPVTTKGYPIVGYTTIEVSSCYANKAAGTAIIGLLNDTFGNSSYETIIKNNGFVTLSSSAASPYVQAVKADFTGNTSGYDLNIDNTTVCGSLPGR